MFHTTPNESFPHGESLPQVDPQPPERSGPERVAWTVWSVALIALIGWADGETGEDIGLSLFYLGPIAVAGWQSGRAGALVAAVSSAVAWVVCECVWWSEHTPLGTVLNGGFRFVAFAFVGLATHRIREDARSQAALQRRLRELLAQEAADARTDHLTGLANARSFLESLRTDIARSQREHRPVCLMYVDLDHFKRVNDLYGHARGDEVLRDVASLFRRSLRASDVPARLGGDEFAALLWTTATGDARTTGERVVEEVAKLGADLAGTELGASVGIVVFHTPNGVPEDLLHEVDTVMYEAKRAGRSRVVITERGARPA